MAVSIFSILRIACFGTIIVFSIVTLGLCAHITDLSEMFLGIYFTFAVMDFMTVVSTFGTLVILLVVDILRTGAVTSLIVVELGTLGSLWVLWLATASLASGEYLLRFPDGCSSAHGSVCGEFAAVVAFSFLNCIIIKGYLVTLVVFSIIAHMRGNSRVWLSSVKQTNFFADLRNNNPTYGTTPVYGQKQEYSIQQPHPMMSSNVQPQYPPMTSHQLHPQPGVNYSSPGTFQPATYSPYTQA